MYYCCYVCRCYNLLRSHSTSDCYYEKSKLWSSARKYARFICYYSVDQDSSKNKLWSFRKIVRRVTRYALSRECSRQRSGSSNLAHAIYIYHSLSYDSKLVPVRKNTVYQVSYEIAAFLHVDNNDLVVLDNDKNQLETSFLELNSY